MAKQSSRESEEFYNNDELYASSGSEFDNSDSDPLYEPSEDSETTEKSVSESSSGKLSFIYFCSSQMLNYVSSIFI